MAPAPRIVIFIVFLLFRRGLMSFSGGVLLERQADGEPDGGGT
jgi:hypothetical protein